MKLIVAYIRPFKIEEVKEALEQAGVAGMTVSEARGHGRQKGGSDGYGPEFRGGAVPRLRLEIAVPDASAASAVGAIVLAARTGRVGDGKVMILPLEQAVRVRTGESGEPAV